MIRWFVVFLVFANSVGLPSRAVAGNTIGGCEMTGARGDMPVSAPARPGGQLTVAVNLPAPLWWNGDTPANLKDGFEYCLAANISWHAGFDRLQVVEAGWHPLTMGEIKDIDFALSEITVSDSRKAIAEFSPSYFSLDVGVLVKAGVTVDERKIKTWRLGVLKNSRAASLVIGQIKPATVDEFEEPGALYSALRNGTIDAALNATVAVLAEAAQEKGVLDVAGQYRTGEGFAILYPKGSPNAANFDKILAALQADGTLHTLADKYLVPALGKDPAMVPYFNP